MKKYRLKQAIMCKALQEELSFDDTYMGKPVADVFDVEANDGILSGGQGRNPFGHYLSWTRRTGQQ